jgi:hypothetical protein
MDEGEGVGEKAPSVSCLRTVTRYHSTRTLCLALGAREGVVLRRGGGHLVFGARVSSVGEESKVRRSSTYSIFLRSSECGTYMASENLW